MFLSRISNCSLVLIFDCILRELWEVLALWVDKLRQIQLSCKCKRAYKGPNSNGIQFDLKTLWNLHK